MQIIRPCITELNRAEFLRYAGLNKFLDAQLEDLLEQAGQEILLLSEPQVVWTKYSHDASCRTFMSKIPYVYHSANLSKHLQDCQAVIAMSATIGEAVEEKITELFATGNYTLAVLLEAGATTLVEQVADYACQFIDKDLQKKGLKTTSRFSPGYADWDLSAQAEFLPLTHGDKINIALTESMMLVPRKSITAIIGVKSNVHQVAEKKADKCATCSNKSNCEFRN